MMCLKTTFGSSSSSQLKGEGMTECERVVAMCVEQQRVTLRMDLYEKKREGANIVDKSMLMWVHCVYMISHSLYMVSLCSEIITDFQWFNR